MKLDASKLSVALPATLLPFVMPIAAFAAEGTGRVSGSELSFVELRVQSIVLIVA